MKGFPGITPGIICEGHSLLLLILLEGFLVVLLALAYDLVLVPFGGIRGYEFVFDVCCHSSGYHTTDDDYC